MYFKIFKADICHLVVTLRKKIAENIETLNMHWSR